MSLDDLGHIIAKAPVPGLRDKAWSELLYRSRISSEPQIKNVLGLIIVSAADDENARKAAKRLSELGPRSIDRKFIERNLPPDKKWVMDILTASATRPPT